MARAKSSEPSPPQGPVQVFRAKAPAKVAGEHRYPTRTVAVPADCDLYTLALTLTGAFDFAFDHAFGFYDNLRNPYDSSVMFELFSDLGEPNEGARGVRGVGVLEAFPTPGTKRAFLFDYGDDWVFEVEFLGTQDPAPTLRYPAVLERKGTAPAQYPDWDEE